MALNPQVSAKDHKIVSYSSLDVQQASHYSTFTPTHHYLLSTKYFAPTHKWLGVALGWG